MPDAIKFVLLLLGAICFATATVHTPAKVNLVALGLLFWVIVPLVAAGEGLH